MISIPIIFGWLRFHRKEQLCLAKKPLLVCHWNAASWMKTDLYSKRLFCIGRDKNADTFLHDFNPWWSRE